MTIALLKSLRRMEILRHKQEEKLFQQSRLVQMGEMISMIAHQWRQPLAAISATIGTLQIKQAMGRYDEKFYDEQLNNIESLSQHLSETIDDFRNFYKPNKKTVKIKNNFFIRPPNSFTPFNFKIILCDLIIFKYTSY